jgi:hypothetical protein
VSWASKTAVALSSSVVDRNVDATAVAPIVDPATWQEVLEETFGLVAGTFGRVEPRRACRDMLLGLLPILNDRGLNLGLLAFPPVDVHSSGLSGYHGVMRYGDGGGLTEAGRLRREQIRIRAGTLFAQGADPVEVAARLEVSTKSAYAWRRAWVAGGVDALASKGPSGPAADRRAGPAAGGQAGRRVGRSRLRRPAVDPGPGRQGDRRRVSTVSIMHVSCVNGSGE